MAKWWQFWASDKAPAPGRPKPTGGKAGTGKVTPPPSPKKRLK